MWEEEQRKRESQKRRDRDRESESESKSKIERRPLLYPPSEFRFSTPAWKETREVSTFKSTATGPDLGLMHTTGHPWPPRVNWVLTSWSTTLIRSTSTWTKLLSLYSANVPVNLLHSFPSLQRRAHMQNKNNKNMFIYIVSPFWCYTLICFKSLTACSKLCVTCRRHLDRNRPLNLSTLPQNRLEKVTIAFAS